MTRKQIRKLANQITQLELVHRNPDSSKEEKSQAEKKIIQISSMLALLPKGLETMEAIDEIVQTNIANEENKIKGE